MYGKKWKQISQHVGTRNNKQVLAHADSFFVKLEKKEQTMEDFLESLDMSNLKDSDYKLWNDNAVCTGYWTRDEHCRFLEGLKMYGQEWKSI